jgi:hypothetical protein
VGKRGLLVAWLSGLTALSLPASAAEPGRPAIRPHIAPAWLQPIMDHPPNPAAGGCLSPSEIVAATADRDAVRLAGVLADPALCLGVIKVAGASGPWTLIVVAHRNRRGPRWVVPHDDEQVGFDAGVEAVLHYGGVLVAVEAGESRMRRGVDPNRVFGAGVCRRGRADPAYTAAVLAGLDRRFPIVALHSNERHGGTISMARPYAGATAFRAKVPSGGTSPTGSDRLPRRDDDTMVVLAGAGGPSDAAARAAIAWFTTHGANVLYETVRAERNDCSLSNYVVLSGLGRSYSVEVADGDSRSARSLVDLVMAHAGIPPR